MQVMIWPEVGILIKNASKVFDFPANRDSGISYVKLDRFFYQKD